MRQFLYIVLLILASSCTQGILLAESASTFTSRNKLRNEILLWDNPQLEIKGDPELCFMIQQNNQLIRHVVTSCDSLFSKLLERLYLQGMRSFPRDRLSFLVDGLLRYFVHALHDIRLGTSSDKTLIVHSQKIFLLLINTSREYPEYFPPVKVKQIYSGSFDAMFPLFFRLSPTEYSRALFDFMESTPDFLTGFRGMVLRSLLVFQYGDYSWGQEALRELSSFGVSRIVRTLLYAGAQNSTDTSLGQSPVSGGASSGSLQVSIFLLLSGFAGYVLIMHSDKLKWFENKAVSDDDVSSPGSKERAELRELRHFFALRPTEGVASLHKKYRTFVRTLHPDIVRDNGESFISLQERYNRARLLLIRLEEEKHRRLVNDL